MYTSLSSQQIRLTLAVCWLMILLISQEPVRLIIEYGGFLFLGIVGAIFANSTGAGGGVIFVPFFNQLNFDPQTTVATSFAIQCCGMTAGALTWWYFYRNHRTQDAEWSMLPVALRLTVPCSVAGIWWVQFSQDLTASAQAGQYLHVGFGIFSILLATAIFATLPYMRQSSFRQDFSRKDMLYLPIISFIGGMITAWLSIGVGELIAVYLIMRRFNVTFAIAVAVILSAFSVWAGVFYHALVTGAVYWPVILFAGFGAILGGMLAKRLVLYFSATNLKIFFASWVMILGIASLPLG